MAVTETLQKLDDASGIPVDPNVRIPDYVKRAAAQADAVHKEAYYKQPEQPPHTHAAAPQPEPAPAPQPEPAPQPVAEAAPQPEPQPEPQPDQNISPEDWRHRYLSMNGRFHKSETERRAMEQQMQQLAFELQRQQEIVQQLQQPAQPQAAQPQTYHEKLITDQDREDYGDDMINMARRAALDAISPELQRLKQENAELTNRVKSTAKRELFTVLDQRLPQWRQINNDTRFKSWLRLPNVYTGRVRMELLNAAVEGANAPVVLQLFNDFLREANITAGQSAPAPSEEQPVAAPRTPAVALEALAAPGRAKPAPGQSEVPSEKPIYTRAQISKFYEDSRKGYYDGRKAEYEKIQADLSAAQREGRIRG